MVSPLRWMEIFFYNIHTFLRIGSCLACVYRGYYKVARRYEFYFRVAKQYFTNERSEWVKYCFCHEKIKFISSSRRVMFFLLYRHADDVVFDDFPKISDHLTKISEDFQNCSEGQRNVSEHFPRISENFQRCPKISDNCRRLSRKTRRCFDDKVARNSFQHFPRRSVWWVIITTLSVDATIMVSKNCPIIGEHVGIIFVTQ